MQSGFGGSGSRPKTVLVSDFVLSSDVTIVDRGYTARLERKIGSFPTFERKQRTIARVNDEIVATIIAALREAGLDAQPGSEEGLSLSDQALLIGGRLRPVPGAPANKDKLVMFGGGHVVADMTVSYFSAGGKKQLLSFTAEPKGAGKPPAGKQAAARNAAIAAALAEEKSAPEKLSGDVEGQARSIARAAAEKIIAFAKERGWMERPEGAEVQPGAESMSDERVKLPEPKPAQSPEKKPAA